MNFLSVMYSGMLNNSCRCLSRSLTQLSNRRTLLVSESLHIQSPTWVFWPWIKVFFYSGEETTLQEIR